jgi:hypothetical protein
MMPRGSESMELAGPLGIGQPAPIATYSAPVPAICRHDKRRPARQAVPTHTAVNYSHLVSLLRRKSADPAPEPIAAPVPEVPQVGKGRPTPKRSQAQGRRGPVAPPPKTQREAVKRSKEVGRTLTKEERRAQSTERRERMMRGDDAYVLPRDRGAVRAYVRDAIDARRNVAGILLPVVVLSFIILTIQNPVVATFGPLVLMVAILAAVVDSVIFGRQISRRVAEKFPKGDGTGLSTKPRSLGFYAFNRACLIRKWRVPRPRVRRGDPV